MSGPTFQELLVAVLRLLLSLLQRNNRPPTPSPFRFSVLERKANMGTAYQVTAAFQPVPAPSNPPSQTDVASSQFTVTVNGTASAPVTIPLTQTTYDLPSTNQPGDVVAGSLVHVDGFGNVSQTPATATITVSAATGPPTPSAFTFSVVEVSTP